MKKYKFKMISDPGHAWLEVPLAIMESLGIASDITGYSYVKDGMIYLEEDSDFSTFMAAARKKKIKVTIEEVYQDPSPIRGYRRYQLPVRIVLL